MFFKDPPYRDFSFTKRRGKASEWDGLSKVSQLRETVVLRGPSWCLALATYPSLPGTKTQHAVL